MIVTRLCGLGLLILLALLPGIADTPLPQRAMRVGDSAVWSYHGMTTAATGDPAVADILPLSTHGLLVNAKGPGRTTIVVFDAQGRHATQVTVSAAPTHWPEVAAQIQQEIGLPTVTARAIQGVIFLEGTAPNTLSAERAMDIAQVYAPSVKNLIQTAPAPPAAPLADTYAALINDAWSSRGITARVVNPTTIALLGTYMPPAAQASTDDTSVPDTADEITSDTGDLSRPTTPRKSESATKRDAAQDPLSRLLASLPSGLSVVDLVQIGDRPVQQILVRAKVIDIDRNSLSQLGVQWGTLQFSTSHSGPDYSLAAQPILFGQSPLDVGGTALSGSALKQFYPLAAALSALITENKARVLSEPSLLVRDGAMGSMLVGGEIPVPVAQTSNGLAGANISVEYKPYGVRLQVQPTIVAAGTIQLTATPEVSELDYGNGVNFNGLSIPALTVRRATSTLQMHDGQTLVIGGLYSNSAQREVQRIPLLSELPVLGEFFKYIQNRKEESELLILLSVQIVAPDSPETQPPAPGSPDNPGIGKPDIARDSFDDFPDIKNLGKPDKNKPKVPLNLPSTAAPGGTP